MPDIDVLVIGGGLGGVAAAIAVAEAGNSVALVEGSQWLGGQMTGQGVCTPDESGINGQTVMDSCGATASYQKFRQWVLGDYVAEGMQVRTGPDITGVPGNNWTSNDGFGVEATRGNAIFTAWLSEAGVTVLLGATYGSPVIQNQALTALTVQANNGAQTVYNPKYILDATETGDLAQLLGLPFNIGAEADGFQNETNGNALEPTWIQPITYPFAIRYQPNQTTPTVTEKPAAYDTYASVFDLFNDTSTIRDQYTGFLTYRRVIDHSFFPNGVFPYDICLVNVGSNDYVQGIYPTGDPGADTQALQNAQILSRCYLYYLQNEAPRTKGGAPAGWPEFVPDEDFFGTGSCLSPLPYIREARRMVTLGYVVKDDIIGPQDNSKTTTRAKLFSDACGVGNYAMDVHSIHNDHCYYRTNPFQIRTSQLVPQNFNNLLAAGKCLGCTHVSSGAFRLHPQEWNIGESAGTLAAFCIASNTAPAQVVATDAQLAAYQANLVSRGIPIFWWTDISVDHPQFAAIQMMGVRQIFSGDAGVLTFNPNGPFTAQEQQDIDAAIGQTLPWPSPTQPTLTRAAAAAFVAQQLNLIA
jgi:hypothetical protein